MHDHVCNRMAILLMTIYVFIYSKKIGVSGQCKHFQSKGSHEKEGLIRAILKDFFNKKYATTLNWFGRKVENKLAKKGIKGLNVTKLTYASTKAKYSEAEEDDAKKVAQEWLKNFKKRKIYAIV